jgi:hypothetical protein
MPKRPYATLMYMLSYKQANTSSIHLLVCGLLIFVHSFQPPTTRNAYVSCIYALCTEILIPSIVPQTNA